jgi:hypothetical protein
VPLIGGSLNSCSTAIGDYVDATLGDSSVNTCWEVDTDQAFAEQPLGLRTPAAIRG